MAYVICIYMSRNDQPNVGLIPMDTHMDTHKRVKCVDVPILQFPFYPMATPVFRSFQIISDS